MRAVKLTIPGTYWDSQIYSGELLLLDEDGALFHVDWRQAVDVIADQNPSVQTAVRVAFTDSDLFYNPKVRKILLDPELSTPIINQLKALSNLQLQADFNIWGKFLRKTQSPFDFLPLDTEIYYNRIIAGGDNGLFSAPRGFSRSFKINTEKHHDATFFQVKASDSYTAIAAAAGDDGLFEFDFKADQAEFDKETLLSPRPCSACDWSFQSVIGWTRNNAFFANFKESQAKDSKRKSRVFDKVLEASQAFVDEIGQTNSSQTFFWGAREKVYRLTENGISVSNYNNTQNKIKNNKGKESNIFGQLGFKVHAFDASKVVATGTAPFGTVIEMMDSLIVWRSDGEFVEFTGAPTHWRVFPRSENYSNQLHIIYEDRLEIISFVHDYFVDQKTKLAGFSRGPNNDFFDNESFKANFNI